MELVLGAVFLCAAAAGLIQRFAVEPGIDLYHIWGVTAAQDLATEPLGSPYAEPGPYRRAIHQAAAASSDTHFQSVVAERRQRGFDPTGTPLFYASFFFLPSDYSTAHSTFRALQLFAFVGAVMLCARLAGFRTSLGFCLGAALANVYQPFLFDAGVGNVSSLQLLAVALLVGFLRRETAKRPVPELLGFAALALLVLFKPNLVLLPVGLAAAWCLRKDRNWFAAAGGILAALVVAALGTLAAFGTLGVWTDWWAYLLGGEEQRLASYPIERGNLSSAKVLAGWWTSGGETPNPYPAAVFLGLSLVASTALAIGLRARREVLAFREAASSALDDPVVAASLAILATFALSPMAWTHYQVLALIPAFFLLGRGRMPGWPTTLSIAIGLALVAGVVTPFLQWTIVHFQWKSFVPMVAFVRSFFWLALLLPLLARIARPETVAGAPALEVGPGA